MVDKTTALLFIAGHDAGYTHALTDVTKKLNELFENETLIDKIDFEIVINELKSEFSKTPT